MTISLRARGSVGRALRAAGARELQPGVYSLDGEMHVDAEELLVAKGIEPTPENQAMLERAALRVAGAHGIPAEGCDW